MNPPADLLVKRWLPYWGRSRYRQRRCAVCYRRFWPWQERWKGANYFPHPYMQVHPLCGQRKAEELRHG